MIGRTLGNYRIVEQIGMGGMATVYKAYDPDTDRYVAVKVLPHHFSHDPTFRERFQREAKAIARLEHLHILPIYAYGEEEGTAFMAMRYLQAGTLTDRIQQGPLPLDETARLLSQIASALDHAHANGVLHRDIKPSNVLLDAANNAFLTDFGIAKMVEATVDLTGGGILGTPAYMSPEQCRGKTELTPASDQYSLGIVLYEMVTGRTPFQAETPIALIHMQLNEPLPLPRQIRPELSEDAQRVILKGLAKEPESRYQSCGAMSAAFAEAVARQPEPQPPVIDDATILSPTPAAPTRPDPAVALATVSPDTPEPATTAPPPQRRSRRWLFALGGVFIVGLLIVGALGLRVLRQQRLAETSRQVETYPTVVEEEPAVSPEEPVLSDRPPLQNILVSPCDWDGLGPGLCLAPLDGGKPIKILTDTALEITGAPSWSPDGRHIAFSAVEPGQEQSVIHIVDAFGNDLHALPPVDYDVSPAWSPDGEWLAFESGGMLAVMRPDGSDPAVLWQSEDNDCVLNPQWSPNSEWILASTLNCDWNFPATRRIWAISRAGDTVNVAAVEHENEECFWPEAAFSPDGSHVAYFDGACRPWLTNADGSGQAETLDDFPYGWLASAHPQWGGGSPTEEAVFTESFVAPPLDLGRWEPAAGALDRDAVFIEEDQLWINLENNQTQPWEMSLTARLAAPVNSIEYALVLEEARGRRIGFGVRLVTESGQSIDLWLNEHGAVLTEEAGQPRQLRPDEPLPAAYLFLLELTGDELIVYVNDEPAGAVPVAGFATDVEFWARVESRERLIGSLDDVWMNYVELE